MEHQALVTLVVVGVTTTTPNLLKPRILHWSFHYIK
jgi:hypothetical protein